MLKKIQTNPFASVIWILLSCVIHFVLLSPKINPGYEVWQRILSLIIAVCLTLPVHELLHFVFMKMFCKGSVKIRIIKSPIGLPTLGTTAQGEFKKWQMVIFYLAPFVFLTLLPDVIFLFCTQIELLFFIIPICNSAGCFYDILETLIITTHKD
ncbi:MAG: DUF3267 domain-containing protein [Oscillospiraceae bacterium]|nr:DUF3267 domain-containing protein [Oscillospiraceae bacterium]